MAMTKKERSALAAALAEISQLKVSERTNLMKLEASENLVKELRRNASERWKWLERTERRLKTIGRAI